MPPPYDPDGSGRRVSLAVREAVIASRVVCLNFSHDVCELNLRFRCACCFRFLSITCFFVRGVWTPVGSIVSGGLLYSCNRRAEKGRKLQNPRIRVCFCFCAGLGVDGKDNTIAGSLARASPQLLVFFTGGSRGWVFWKFC